MKSKSRATDWKIRVDLRTPHEAWELRRAAGNALRGRVPREIHAVWKPPKDRPCAVSLINASNVGRQEQLVPIRIGRMAASPFAFLRGAASVMAQDLSGTPVSGINAIINGDAHVNNFGLFGTPQRDVIFDLNDFDETLHGPWEWDLKRLVASVNVAGRDNGQGRRERRCAVTRCVAGYRSSAAELQSMSALDLWYLHAHPERSKVSLGIDPESRAVMAKAVAKARRQTNASLLGKMAQRGTNGAWKFHNDPPVLTHLDSSTRSKIIHGLNRYTESLPAERRHMLSRYHVADVIHRVVGIGSVGTRTYLALLFGNSDADPLFLQLKEAVEPSLACYVPRQRTEDSHQGKRVVQGQRILQASSDVLLGWTTIDDRPFYVRQMKDLKASIPLAQLSGRSFEFYAWVCGSILARAHARAGDAARIAGYCGNSSVLDEALADWAEAYGDQTEYDHAALKNAIKGGQMIATVGI